MNRTTLDTLDHDRIAEAFNTVYTGYFMPFNVDANWVARLPERNGIVFEASPLWLDDGGAVIGMAALAVRGDRGWVGGFGMSPRFRGRGLSHDLAQAMLECARDTGIRRLDLEVMAQNTAAIRVYQRAGFCDVRDLLSLTAPALARPVSQFAGTAGIQAVPDLIEARARMPVVRPAWQREVASLASADGLRAIVIGAPSTPRAIAFVVDGSNGIGLLDAAALDAVSARELLDAIADSASSSKLTLWNEPEDSELLPALHKQGWSEILRQHEMTFTIG